MDAGELLECWSKAQRELWAAERELKEAQREAVGEPRAEELRQHVLRHLETCDAAWRRAIEALARGTRADSRGSP